MCIYYTVFACAYDHHSNVTLLHLFFSSSPHLLSRCTPPSRSFMSLLFISLISDCFFPLESASPCQRFPRGERRDLRSILARRALFLTLLNRVETIPSAKPHPAAIPTLFRIQGTLLAGMRVWVSERNSGMKTE